MFREGEKVYSLKWGWGVVTEISYGEYPVKITFLNNTEENYTKDGKWMLEDLNPDLFFEEVKLPERVRPKPNLKIDDPILVSANGGSDEKSWQKRHFAGWDSDGKIIAFNNGATSWSTDDRLVTWEYWRLPNAN
jgi:hypothetical protein